jgi:hypothetical protein
MAKQTYQRTELLRGTLDLILSALLYGPADDHQIGVI